MFSRPVFAALILAAAVSRASGLEAMLGNAFVSMPPSPGFCELTPMHEFDGRMVDTLSKFLEKAGVRLLVMSADCAQLDAAREGKRLLLDDVIQYQVRFAEMQKRPMESIAQACTALRARALDAVVGDTNARFAATIAKMKANETSFVGVLAEDKNACYGAVLQKLVNQAGGERRLVGLFAATIVSDRSIGVYRYAVYQNPETINPMLAKLKDDVAALIAANR
jgi:hypothetical protein